MSSKHKTQQPVNATVTVPTVAVTTVPTPDAPKAAELRCTVPYEGADCLMNAIGLYQNKPWAQHGVWRVSKDGRKWKAAKRGSDIVLYAETGRHESNATVQRKRMIEERLQPVMARREQFKAILDRGPEKAKVSEQLRAEYQAHFDKADADLKVMTDELASIEVPKIGVESWVFPMGQTFILTVTP